MNLTWLRQEVALQKQQDKLERTLARNQRGLDAIKRLRASLEGNAVIKVTSNEM